MTSPRRRDEPAAGDRRRRTPAPSSRCRGRPGRPSSRISCQARVMKTVSPLPAATSTSATATTRRMPKRSISAAANGAVSPYSSRFTETAARDRAARPAELLVQRRRSARPARTGTPAAPMRVTKATAATTQARRRMACGGSAVERCESRSRGQPAATGADEWPEGHHAQESGHDRTRPHRVAVLALDRGRRLRPAASRRRSSAPPATPTAHRSTTSRSAAATGPGPHRRPASRSLPDHGPEAARRRPTP